MAPMNIFPGIDWREFFVWWDYENCPVPKGYDAFRVFDAVVAGLKQRGFHGPVKFQAVVSLAKNMCYDNMMRLYHCNIPFVSADPEYTGFNAADKKIERLIGQWIEEWEKKGKPPAGVLIITSDYGFRHIARRCKHAGLLTGLFYVEARATYQFSKIAHFDHHWLNVLNLAPEADPEKLARHGLLPVRKRFQANLFKNRQTFDAFLLEHPLHYEKWIEYIDGENSLGSRSRAYSVYERALKVLTHSIDLWVHYCNQAIYSNWPPDEVRKLFARAIVSVGCNYNSTPLWRTIIEFESTHKNWSGLAMVYTRLLMHPIQYLDEYLRGFMLLVRSFPLSRLISAEEAGAAAASGAPYSLNVQNYINIREVTYSAAKQFQSLIVGFETALTSSYYREKLPIDEDELKMWHHYLNFIEEQDLPKVINLYERCLIACAYRPEYWVRYVLCMHKRHQYDYMDKIIHRATNLVFPKMENALKVLKPLLDGGNDDRLLSQACLALFRRLDGAPVDMIEAVVSENVFPLLVELLGHPSFFVFFNAYRVVGNIVKCVDSQSQFIIGSDILPKLYKLLVRDDIKGIQRGICWIISKITSGKGVELEVCLGLRYMARLLVSWRRFGMKMRKSRTNRVSVLVVTSP